MKRFCFDIDGVICSTKNNKYHLSKPNKKAIEKINELYSSGNYIVIFTSRYMGRSKERPAIAKKEDLNLLRNNLKLGVLNLISFCGKTIRRYLC